MTIHVDAAPSIADPITALAKQWTGARPTSEGQCIAVAVTPLQSSNAEQILAGGGASGGSGDGVSLWIPDSTTWATRLQDDVTGSGSATEPEIHAPIASSPLVFVSSPKVVSMFVTRPDWKAALVGAFPAGHPGPRDEHRGLLSLQIMNARQGSTRTGPNPTLASVMLRLSHSTLPDASSGFAQLAADPAHASVFTAPEQAVIQATAPSSPCFAAASYPDEGTLSLDYPVVRQVRSGDNVTLTAALDAFEQELRSQEADKYFADAGFRDASGGSVPGVGAAQGVGAAPIRQLAKPTAGQGVDTLRLWVAITEDVNSLAVIDVSGSMAESGGNGQSKIQIAAAATSTAVGFYPNSSDLGLWIFSTQTPTTPWTQLVSIGQIGDRYGPTSRRMALVDATRSLPGRVQGNTALYDTALAAVNAVRPPGKVATGTCLHHRRRSAGGYRSPDQDLAGNRRQDVLGEGSLRLRSVLLDAAVQRQ